MNERRQPVLLIHGAWHGPWTWEEWIPLLREHGYEAEAVTLRGHGFGGKGYRGVGLEDYRQDLDRISRVATVEGRVWADPGQRLVAHGKVTCIIDSQ